MLEQTIQAGAVPVLEAMIRFTGQRQRLLAHNVANLTTPNFQALDASPEGFQAMLAEAVHARRRANGGVGGPLPMRSTRQVRVGGDGSLALRPERVHAGPLLHDRNNRDVERLMQAMTENYGMYRVASDLLRSRVGELRTAISQRVG
ncbi:MAG: flagellar basal body rod protein FlgB [Phycisphaerales bacterium]|nr:MAG: flagellar basal body rod protein FlgB [Phycisphaerales bacterium]